MFLGIAIGFFIGVVFCLVCIPAAGFIVTRSPKLQMMMARRTARMMMQARKNEGR